MTGRVSPSVQVGTSAEHGDVKLRDFCSSLTQFIHHEPPLRRSPRKIRVLSSIKPESVEDALPAPLPSNSSPSRKRDLAFVCDDTKIFTHSPKKQKRGYAAPEIYAHLNILQDYLKPELDSGLFSLWDFYADSRLIFSS